jgi:hypothetical protein
LVANPPIQRRNPTSNTTRFYINDFTHLGVFPDDDSSTVLPVEVGSSTHKRHSATSRRRSKVGLGSYYTSTRCRTDVLGGQRDRRGRHTDRELTPPSLETPNVEVKVGGFEGEERVDEKTVKGEAMETRSTVGVG